MTVAIGMCALCTIWLDASHVRRHILAVVDPDANQMPASLGVNRLLVPSRHICALGDCLYEAVWGEQPQAEVFAEPLEDALAVAHGYPGVSGSDLVAQRVVRGQVNPFKFALPTGKVGAVRGI